MRAARLAWSLVAVSVVCEITDTLITSRYRALLSEESLAVHGWPLTAFATMGAATMGALIVARYPRHPVGWLLSVVGAGSSVSLVTEGYSVWVLDHGGPGSASAGHVSGWVSLLLGGPFALTGLAVMFLLAPDGRLLSPRWRWAVVLAASGLGCFAGGLLILPGVSAGDMVIEPGDVGGGTITRLFSVGLWLITVALIAAVISLLMRTRHAKGALRKQLWWIAASGVFLPAGLIWRQVLQHTNGGQQTWSATVPLFVAYFFIPIFTAMAVLRHHMYDVELIVNRAVVFAVGTLLVAGGYVAIVVGVGGFLGARAGGYALSVMATALVALAFQPLRRRVARLADRIAYGSRALPYEALSDFSQRIGESPAPQSLLPAVAEAAGRAVSARRGVAVLELQGDLAQTATWPRDAPQVTPDLEVTVRDSGGTLGRIGVEMHRGRALRADEIRLLEGLAQQAAVAFRNAALDADATANVVALDLRTHELAASRRRIVDAREAESRRLEAAITRDVFPILDRLARTVGRLQRSAETAQPLDGVDELVAEVSTALDRLRGLSHGVFPSRLLSAGIGPALAAYLATSHHSARLEVDPSIRGRRFGRAAEAAAYFCCVEALPHCRGDVAVSLDVDELVVHVDGIIGPGFDHQVVNDRVEALAGSLVIDLSGDTARLTLRVPVDRASARVLG
jgi:GAF domain-containing protein